MNDITRMCLLSAFFACVTFGSEPVPLTVESFAADRASIWRTKYDIVQGNTTLPIKQCGHDETRVYWWAPAAETPRRDTVAVYMPFPNENIAQGGMAAKSLATEAGFTVISVPFDTADKDKDFDLEDPTVSYLRKGSGYAEAALEAWKWIRKERGLPDKPFVVGGYSGGGILSQRMSEWYPANAAACASYGGHSYMQGAGCRSPLLIMHAFSDPNAKFVPGLLTWARFTGSSVVAGFNSGEWPNRGYSTKLFHHHPRTSDQTMLVHWLGEVSDLVPATNRPVTDADMPFAVTTPGVDPEQYMAPGGSVDHWPPKIFDAKDSGWRRKLNAAFAASAHPPGVAMLPGRASVADWLDLVPAPFTLAVNTAPSAKPSSAVWWCPPAPLRPAKGFCWRVRGAKAKTLEYEVPDAARLHDLRCLADNQFVAIDTGPAPNAQTRAKIRAVLTKLVPMWKSLPEAAVLEQPSQDDIASMPTDVSFPLVAILDPDEEMGDAVRRALAGKNISVVALRSRDVPTSNLVSKLKLVADKKPTLTPLIVDMPSAVRAAAILKSAALISASLTPQSVVPAVPKKKSKP